ncbi:lactonase family protein [Paenibacillus sediminis]|uniref:6-phosphogluconolactonase n=1 Tax=Paenibacillus sediminis TaxID=664909 RepID=A0ABS4GY76_9BACL|nr:lactonase family protein [Paenibacillus sediminis]MBP1935220.1 6-phosphogluconolactonase [Paenibacillus sediminis]
MTTQSERMLLFIGSYAEASDPGVYVYSFDETTGELTRLHQVSGIKNPTFLNLDAQHKKLYSIGETVSNDGKKVGEVISFAVDTGKGTLTELNRVQSTDATTCHIQRDAEDRYLIVASYHGGKIGLLSLEENGMVGKLLDMKQHEGKGAHPERQSQPHPHSAFFSPDGRFIFVPDLGIDRIRAYTINHDSKKLEFHGETATHPGAGPRHLAFHPNGNLAFVINEVDSSITSFRYDAEAGQLHTIETVSTLPAEFQGENTTAEIRVSNDGKYLYGSNRGHDSIVVYAIDAQSGKLTYVEHVPTEGGHPRHFTLTPNGNYLISANRDSNNLTVFRVNQQTGKLEYTGRSAEVSKPVCVIPAYL